MAHRARDLLIRQRTQLINALRAHLAELGLIAAQGKEGIATLTGIIRAEATNTLPPGCRAALLPLIGQLESLEQQIGALDKVIRTQHRASAASQRLETIPGIGIIGATAIVATITDPCCLQVRTRPRRLDRAGAATELKWRQGTARPHLQARRPLSAQVTGGWGGGRACAHAKAHPEKHPWLMQLLARRPVKVVMVALANKMARIAWAVLMRGETYRPPVIVPVIAVSAGTWLGDGHVRNWQRLITAAERVAGVMME